MASNTIDDADKVVLVPTSEDDEGRMLAGQVPLEACPRDTAAHAHQQVMRLEEQEWERRHAHPHEAAQTEPVDRRPWDANTSANVKNYSTEVEEALGLEHHERQAKRDHQPHEQHRHPEADDRAEGKPGITGVSRQRGSSGAGGSSKVDQQGRERPAGSGEGPTQWAALQEPLLQPDDAEHQGVSHEHGHGHDPMQQRSVGGGGSSGITGAVRHALSSGRETVKGIVERVEKAVGFQPASEHQTPPDHTAVTLPHSGVPHSPAEAARERQQQQQQQHHGVLGVSAANNAAALVRELPTLESIRDSARGYVEALRHSVKDPSETAAEVAGRMVGKDSYSHPVPMPHPHSAHGSPTPGSPTIRRGSHSLGATPPGGGSPPSTPIAGGGGGSPRLFSLDAWGAKSSSEFGAGPTHGSSSHGLGLGPLGLGLGRGGPAPPGSVAEVLANPPEAASELAGRIVGKANYRHPPQHAPHAPPYPPVPPAAAVRSSQNTGAHSVGRPLLGGSSEERHHEAALAASPAGPDQAPGSGSGGGSSSSSGGGSGGGGGGGGFPAPTAAAGGVPLQTASDPHSGLPLAAMPHLLPRLHLGGSKGADEA